MRTFHYQPSFLGNSFDNNFNNTFNNTFNGNGLMPPQLPMNSMLLTEQQKQDFLAFQSGGHFPTLANNTNHFPQPNRAQGAGMNDLFGHSLPNGYLPPINGDDFNGVDTLNIDPSNLGFNAFDINQPNLSVATTDNFPALSTIPTFDEALIDPMLQAISGMQNTPLPTPPLETPLINGGVFTHNLLDFAIPHEHDTVPTEWPEVVNNNAVTPPKLTEENNVLFSNPYVNGEVPLFFINQGLPTPPESAASSSPNVASTSIGPIRSQKKTRSARKEAQKSRNCKSGKEKNKYDENEERRERATGLRIEDYITEVEAIREQVKTTCKQVSPDVTSVSKRKVKCHYDDCCVVDVGRRVAEHIQLDHLERRPQCPHCGKKIYRRDAYLRHMNTCRKCDFCEKVHVSVKQRRVCKKRNNAQ